MVKRRRWLRYLSVAVILLSCPGLVLADEPQPDFVGTWYGTYQVADPTSLSGTFRMVVFEEDSELFASFYAPQLGVLDSVEPVTVEGDTMTVSIPLVLTMEGTISDGSLSGTFSARLPVPPFFYSGTWQASKAIEDEIVLPSGPGPDCSHLPSFECVGSDWTCGQLVSFNPRTTVAYSDYPLNGETSENQYRSYLRRDLMQLVQYATAQTHCKSAQWAFGIDAPLGLGDMSEADGSIPGTSIGSPGHPAGTHENGRDLDTAYYQFYAPDNHLRPVCDHYEGLVDVYHCTEEAHALDKYRTALFLSFLAEHPRLRVVGVDGKIGPGLEEALDELVAAGWVSADLRAEIPLMYEETDQGLGWYQFHHHHLHISINPLPPASHLIFLPLSANG